MSVLNKRIAYLIMSDTTITHEDGACGFCGATKHLNMPYSLNEM